MKNSVFAGSFDPITKGHENIIQKCANSFDNVFVVIGKNDKKSTLYSETDRLNMLKLAIKKYSNVKAVLYSDYNEKYIQFLKENEIAFYIRGIRNEQDKIYEDNFIKQNKLLYPFVETIYVYPDKEFVNISSTVVKDKLKKGEVVDEFLSCEVNTYLTNLKK